MSLHDAVIGDLHDRPHFKVGDMVFFESNSGELYPVTISHIDFTHFGVSGYRYVIKSVLYPSMDPMLVHPSCLRPVIRTKQELKQILRIVK